MFSFLSAKNILSKINESLAKHGKKDVIFFPSKLGKQYLLKFLQIKGKKGEKMSDNRQSVLEVGISIESTLLET